LTDIQRLRLLLQQLKRLGVVWFFFDNCESVLTEDNRFQDERLTTFMEMAVNYKPLLRLILTTRELPVFEGSNRVSLIEMKGQLPPVDAVDYLKQLARDFNTSWRCDDAEVDELLGELARRLRYIPKALFSFASYYAQEREQPLVLKNVLTKEDLFSAFEAFNFEKGYSHLVQEQFESLSDLERAVWLVLSVFREPVSADALRLILRDYELDTVWEVLGGNGLIMVDEIQRTEEEYVRLFSLEDSARQYIFESLPKQLIDYEGEKHEGHFCLDLFCQQRLHVEAGNYYLKSAKPIEECFSKEQFEPHFKGIDHFIEAGFADVHVTQFSKILERLNDLRFMQELANRCQKASGKFSERWMEGHNSFILGQAFLGLGKILEALAEFDKAAVIGVECLRKSGDLVSLGLLLLTARASRVKARLLLRLGRLDAASEDIDQSSRIFEGLRVEDTQNDWSEDIAEVHKIKGAIRSAMKDSAGSAAALSEATAIYERLVSIEARPLLLIHLAECYEIESVIAQSQGQFLPAISKVEKTIRIYENLVVENQHKEFSFLLASAYVLKTRILHSLNQLHPSLIESEKALRILEELVKTENRKDLAESLGGALSGKANTLLLTGAIEESLAVFQSVVDLFEELVDEDGNDELGPHLAVAYMNLGLALESNGRNTQSLEELTKSINLYHRLVHEVERHDLSELLAGAHFNHAGILLRSEKFEEALIEVDKTIAITEGLIDKEPHEHLIESMAIAYLNKATILMYLRRPKDGLQEAEKALPTLEQLVLVNERTEFTQDLGNAYVNYAALLDELERHNESLQASNKAIRLLEEVLGKEEQFNVVHLLAMAHMNKGSTLKDLYEFNEALEHLNKAVHYSERAMELGGEWRVIPVLAKALRLRCMAATSSLNIKLAKSDAQRIAALYERTKGSKEMEPLKSQVESELYALQVMVNDGRRTLYRSLIMLFIVLVVLGGVGLLIVKWIGS
jgi:tetratricopeptide (TPR) repeat protein